jgi:N6-L-threonylcarbamoyladenine synthase
MTPDLILGIESSCDDTAAAVVDADGQVRSSVIATQTAIHAEWGGVYPEFASRAHVESIVPTIAQALAGRHRRRAPAAPSGATRGPGLIGPAAGRAQYRGTARHGLWGCG